MESIDFLISTIIPITMLIGICIIILSLQRVRRIKIKYHNYSRMTIVSNVFLATISFILGNVVLAIPIIAIAIFGVDVMILILLHITGISLALYRAMRVRSKPPHTVLFAVK